MTDPFVALASPLEPQTPRPAFARDLRNRLVAELGLDPGTALPTDLPTIDLPPRSRTMPTTSQDRPRTESAVAANALVPYITVARGDASRLTIRVGPTAEQFLDIRRRCGIEQRRIEMASLFELEHIYDFLRFQDSHLDTVSTTSR